MVAVSESLRPIASLNRLGWADYARDDIGEVPAGRDDRIRRMHNQAVFYHEPQSTKLLQQQKQATKLAVFGRKGERDHITSKVWMLGDSRNRCRWYVHCGKEWNSVEVVARGRSHRSPSPALEQFP